MDQNQLRSLDPKLREAYERVMGSATQPKAQIATPYTPQTPPSQTPSNENAALTSDEKPIIPDIPSPQIHPSNLAQNNELSPQTPASFPPNTPTLPNNASFSTDQHEFSDTRTVPSTSTPAFDTIVANNQMHAYVTQEVAGVKQSLKIIQLIYIVGGLVFFAVYAFFWMKFFNVSSPF